MIFALKEVGLIAEVAGWHVITTHVVAGWGEWISQPQQGLPAFPDGPTVNYIFPTRADYLRELDKANDCGIFIPPIAPPIPTIISMRQTRLTLLQMDLLQTVEAALSQLPEPNRTRALIEWNHAAFVERYNVFVLALCAMLGFTEEDTDNFFIAAATL